MFHVVRVRVVTLLVAGLLVLAAIAQARSHTSALTQQQIQAAVAKAEGSSSLWSTVNVCNSAHPNLIGIRGQMPSLGFPAQLSMTFEVQYWAAHAHVFRLVPGSVASVPLGTSKLGLRQSGYSLPLTAHAGTLRGVVTMLWSRAGRVIGSTTRVTSAGHPDADYGDPAHYTASSCSIR